MTGTHTYQHGQKAPAHGNIESSKHLLSPLTEAGSHVVVEQWFGLLRRSNKERFTQCGGGELAQLVRAWGM